MSTSLRTPAVGTPLPPAPEPGPLEAHLTALRASGRKLLVPYLTGGLGPWTEHIRAVADAGVAVALVERASREHVLGRVRAGVLEAGTVGLLRAAGCADRLAAEGLAHAGIALAYHGRATRIDLERLTGRHVTVYGQTELTHDLMDAHTALGTPIFFGVENAAPQGFDGDRPSVSFRHGGRARRLDADFVVVASGIVELVLGAALVFLGRYRVIVGWIVAAFFVAIFPGNIAQYVDGVSAFGLDTDGARLIRLFFQPVLVVWALWSTGAWRNRGTLLGEGRRR